MCHWCERSLVADQLTAGFAGFRPARREFSSDPSRGSGSGGRTLADVVFRNGSIRTMVPGADTVEALAVAGSTILAAGSTTEVSALTGRATRTVDLEGRTLLPGLIDPHHHYTLSALVGHLMLDVGYSKFHTKAEALTYLKDAATKSAAGQWIAAAYFDNLLQGGELSMTDLDAVSTEHPVFVMYVNGHVGAANTLGFQKAGIAQDVGTLAGGGHFGRGADGTLNGLMYEQPALMRFLAVAVPPTTPELIVEALTSYAKAAAAAGNTTLHEPGTVKPEWVDHLAALSNSLDVRLSGSFSTDATEASKPYAALGPATRARRVAGSRFSLYGMKMWADGSNQAEMAAQTQPYLNSADKGARNYPPAEFARLCQSAKDAGWPILIHCQGDAAVDEALDAIEHVYGTDPATGLNVLQHATMARRDQVERAGRLGVEISFIPDFVYLYGAAYRDTIFGKPRAEFMVPCGAAAQVGLGFSLHSDAPAAGLPINPLRYVQTAVTRRCAIDGSVVGPELGLTVDAALRAATAGAARHVGLQDTVGTLEPGKEADLTILETDPHKCDPEKIMTIPVSETWVAGQPRYARSTPG